MSHESRVKNQIRVDLAPVPGLRLFPNPNGNFWTGKLISMHDDVATIRGARMVKCGLAPDSSDLIGLIERKLNISELFYANVEFIYIAQFASLEVKDQGRATPGQLNWNAMVNSYGGVAGVVHNSAEAIELFNRPLKTA